MISVFGMSFLAGVVSVAALDLPLTGQPLAPEAVRLLEELPGVQRIHADADRLTIEVAPGQEVRLSELERVLAARAPGTRIDRNRLPVSTHTIFELNAGVCFFCAEKPLGQTLGRMPFVQSWSVVDYWTRGRLRFRVEPKGRVLFEALGPDVIEDVVLTGRYDGVRAPDLYWPTGGVAWRPDVESARREATKSRRPLMIFPTAGT